MGGLIEGAPGHRGARPTPRVRPMELHLDALNLMLRDLRVADHSQLHRAAFRGCARELADLRAELIA